MRLLQLQTDGSLSLTEDFVDNVPPYAILSHTWGSDGQEVTFQDIQQQTDQYKEGYIKLKFCGQQAASDDLQYFWVDTCCIDKSNSTELSEAINSMFRWYQNAARCYVYLTDVSKGKGEDTEELPGASWNAAFRKSRWHSRGWTLQELIAPKSVTFFSIEGQRLGDKASLETLLQEITGISVDALRGKPLSEFSINQRFSWMETRATRRAEDRAYSLLGIFNVHIPLIYGEGEQNASFRLREAIEKRSRGPSGIADENGKTHFIVPFGRNSGFVGRESVMKQLLDRTPPSANRDDCQRTALQGLGGIGKTQIAIETAYCVREAHPDCSIFWVPAVDLATFENAYREIGRIIGVQGIDDEQADIKELVKDALSDETAGSWLLIIDNADDFHLFFDDANLMSYLPFSRKGSLLFTTRNHQAAVRFLSGGDPIRLQAMDHDEATQLLRSGTAEPQTDDEQSIVQLLEHLAYLPLAIKQAAAYMASNLTVTVSKYLRYCQSNDRTMIKLLSRDFDDQGRYESIRNPIATTWLISFEQISRDAPLAARYLRFICYLGEKDIPISLFPPAEDEMERDEAISTLKAYAFISNRDTSDRFEIHRLVRLTMRNWLQQQGQQSQQVTETILHLAEEFPWPRHENRNIWTSYLPHAQSVLGFRDECTETEALASLQHSIAEVYDLLGKYPEAEQVHRHTLALREGILGREHPDTLCSLNNLSEALREQGQYKEAEQIQRETLALRERVLGPEHPQTLDSMNNLAELFREQEKDDEAEQMNRQTLAIREKVLGREHPDTLDSLNNLALVLKAQGKPEEAEPIIRETLALKEKVLGPEHPRTLDSLNNLALVLKAQGKYEMAETLQREELRLCEKIRGREHPSTLVSMNNVADVLGNQGKYREAEMMYRQTLLLRQAVLGPENPDTLDSLNDLALMLKFQGKYEEAERLHREELRLCQKVRGREDPSTLISMNNVANVLECQDKHQEAEMMYRQTLALREKVLGREHPDTLDTLSSLEETLRLQGKHEEARQTNPHEEARQTNPDMAATRENKTLVPKHPKKSQRGDKLTDALKNLRIHIEKKIHRTSR